MWPNFRVSLRILAVVAGLGVVRVHAGFLGDVILQDHDADSVLEFYIPTVHSGNELCRDHSRLYLKQLKEFRLWATEMFDATTKFPDGLLYGSSYSLGMFDECLEIKVPQETNAFKGKYCLVNVVLGIDKHQKRSDIQWDTDDYTKYFNESVHEKLAAYANYVSRAKRHQYFIGMCLPSSCSYLDVKDSLSRVLSKINLTNIKFNVNLEPHDCQTADDQYRLTAGDFVFIFIVGAYILSVLVISIYYRCVRSQKKNGGTWFKVVKCFSVSENTKKLLNVNIDVSDGLNHVAGFKVLSLILVIFGHRVFLTGSEPIVNPVWIERLYHRTEASVFMNGTIIVDSFFVITGFLAAYIILQRTATQKSLNPLFLYVHRLNRFLPGYMVIVAFTATIFAKLGSGPLWKRRIGHEMENCQANWWTNALFINNYVNVENICVFQSWYLNCDIHFYIFTPMLVWLYRKRSKTGFITVLALTGLSIVMTFFIIYFKDYDPIIIVDFDFIKDLAKNETFKYVYVPSHMRIIPYLIGILFGFAKFKIRTTGYKFRQPLVRVCWVLSTIAMFVTVLVSKLLYVPKEERNDVLCALYSPLHRLAWSLSVGWMIIASTEGQSGLLKPFTAWKPFIFLNRITFSAFLVHVNIQFYSIGIRRTPTYFSEFYLVYNSLADVFMSYFFGYLLTIFFESPVGQMESAFLRKEKPRKDISYESEKPLTVIDINNELEKSNPM